MGWPLVLSLQQWLCPPSLVVTLTVIMTMLMVLSVRLAKVELVDTLLPEMILLATETMLWQWPVRWWRPERLLLSLVSGLRTLMDLYPSSDTHSRLRMISSRRPLEN